MQKIRLLLATTATITSGRCFFLPSKGAVWSAIVAFYKIEQQQGRRRRLIDTFPFFSIGTRRYRRRRHCLAGFVSPANSVHKRSVRTSSAYCNIARFAIRRCIMHLWSDEDEGDHSWTLTLRYWTFPWNVFFPQFITTNHVDWTLSRPVEFREDVQAARSPIASSRNLLRTNNSIHLI